MGDKKKILYIEDEEYNRILVKKLLESHDFELIEAEDGLTGIKEAEENNFDIVILDINMVGMNGYEIATRLRSMDKYQHTPIIALTASLMEKSKDRALISGCDGFIHKPIKKDTFVKLINEYLQGKKETVEPGVIHTVLKNYTKELVDHLEKEITELKRVNNDLKVLDKLKSDFVSIASHELRTPLVTIVGYVDLLLVGRLGKLNPDHERILNIVSRNIRKLEKIVKDLFTISLIENKVPFLEKRTTDIITMIQNVIEDNALIFEERKLECNLHKDDYIPKIECDEMKVNQVIASIVNNAIKYTEDGGKIDLFIRYPSPNASRKYHIDNTKYIEIVVKDTGIGLPKDKLNKIFEKFVELGNIDKHHSSEKAFMGGGVGLGLPISKGIIEKHNGYIWGENRRNSKGAKFYIILPLKVGASDVFI